MSEDWFEGGLCFECQGSGRCCSGRPGRVLIEDTAPMAAAMGMSQERFDLRYVRVIDGRLGLKERPDGDCALLDPDTRRCLAYEARPRQCRTWPFWATNLRDAAAWARAAEGCPGIGRGRLWTADELRAARRSPVGGASG